MTKEQQMLNHEKCAILKNYNIIAAKTDFMSPGLDYKTYAYA